MLEKRNSIVGLILSDFFFFFDGGGLHPVAYKISVSRPGPCSERTES